LYVLPVRVIALASVHAHVAVQLVFGNACVLWLVAQQHCSAAHAEDAVGDHVVLVQAMVVCCTSDLCWNKQGDAVGAGLQEQQQKSV
jgi:hypothetical protein